MKKKLTILFTPREGVGHVNSSTGIAESLRDRGHRIVFAIDHSFKGQLIPYGFEEELLDQDFKAPDVKPGENMAKRMLDSGLMTGLSSLDKVKSYVSDTKGSLFNGTIEKKMRNESRLQAILEKYSPDVIVIDDVLGSPTLIYSNIPWVLSVSTNPLFYVDDECLPPGSSGITSNLIF